MSDFFQLGDRRLVPLKDVGSLVPYSKDYVARLARDGKIAAAQINRQWYIDPESLKNFFDHAQLEIKARAEYLRSLRREELNLHEWWSAFESNLHAKRTTRHQRSLRDTIVIVILGMFAGLALVDIWPNTEAELLAIFNNNSQQSAQVISGTKDTWYETGVVEVTEETIDISQGILLLPSATTASVTPEEFFSDPVEVIKGTTSIDYIKNIETGATIPFVAVPSTTDSPSIEVITEDDDS